MACANHILDRSWGKPKQQAEVEQGVVWKDILNAIRRGAGGARNQSRIAAWPLVNE